MMIASSLPYPFHWRTIRNIDSDEVLQLAQYLGIEFDRDFHIKSNWSYFKQFDVFSIAGTPIFHIKKSMEKDFFYEALALHLGRIVDPELCPKNYIVGTYDVGFWKWKSPIPFILTTYVEGPSLKQREQLTYLFQLGRQFGFHKFLELHDVYERHFIIRNNLLVRIDFDLSFREMEGKYTGFDRWIKEYKLWDYSDFVKGVNFEAITLKKNLVINKRHFQEIINAIKLMSEMEKNKRDIHDYYNNLMKYWVNNCSDILENVV
jgi:hypothetical protein